MDTQAVRDLAVTVSEVGAAVACLWGGLRYLWPCSKRCVYTMVCAWNRVRVVWAALECLPIMQGEFREHKAELANTKSIVVRMNEAVTMDRPDSLPARLNALVDQSMQRSFELSKHGEQIILLDKKVDSVVNTQRAMLNTNTRTAVFDADDTGIWTAVNRTFLKWTGLDEKEALHWGWLNAIHPDDQERIRDGWALAVFETRRYEARARLVRDWGKAGQRIIEVDITADPIPELMIPCDRWFGTMTEAQSGIIS